MYFGTQSGQIWIYIDMHGHTEITSSNRDIKEGKVINCKHICVNPDQDVEQSEGVLEKQGLSPEG